MAINSTVFYMAGSVIAASLILSDWSYDSRTFISMFWVMSTIGLSIATATGGFDYSNDRDDCR
jgi:hypothetical protein